MRVLDEISRLVQDGCKYQELKGKLWDELGDFVSRWDSGNPNELPADRTAQINPVRNILRFIGNPPSNDKPAYTKKMLEDLALSLLGSQKDSEIGLPLAVEEAAMQMFLEGDNYDIESSEVIRTALKDLRETGSFQFSEEDEAHATE